MKALFTTLLFTTLLTSIGYAQTAEIRGAITNENDEAFSDADVVLYRNENIVNGTSTDENGEFQLEGIYPGKYLLVITYLEQKLYEESLNLSSGEVLTRYHLKANEGMQLDTFVYRRKTTSEEIVVIDPGDIIPHSPEIDVIADISPTVKKEGGTISVGNGRPGGTQFYNGGSVALIGGAPKTFIGLSGVEVIDRGVPARYGNFTGGGVQFKTKEIGVKKENYFQLQSTSPFDGYHHNLGVLYFSRALKTRSNKRNDIVYKSTVFGVSFMANYKFQADPNPSFVKPLVVTDESLQYIYGNPLVSSEVVGGYVPTANFLRESDLEQVSSRPHAQRNDYTGRLKFTWNPTRRLSVDFINTFDYLQRRLSQGNYVLLNSGENPLQKYSFVNSQMQLTHQLKSPYNADGEKVDVSGDLISRLKYSVELNYQQSNSEISNARHGKKFFDYGYVGAFKSIQVPTYRYIENGNTKFIDENGEEQTLKNYYEFAGYRDSLVEYVPGNQNRSLSDYTQFFYNKQTQGHSMQDLIARGGVINGQNLPLLYSLYANSGSVYGDYSKSFQKRMSAIVSSEFALHPFKSNRDIRHDFEVGLMFQQDVLGSYNLNASRLWQLMPLLANSHIQNVDRNNPIISTDENGRFTDTVSYPVFVDVDAQKEFDKNLREKLIQMNYRDANGNLITSTSKIDVNALSPDVFDLSMFSADELLNNGNSYVFYSGYDYMGNRVRGKSGLKKFLNDSKNRPNDAFAPITAAGWIQDKFVLKSMIIRAGLRFERYDANQQVLKDPFSIYPIKQAGEVSTINGQAVSHPNSIGDDYAVYVDNVENPNKIIGYRNGNNWFDAEGKPISDPSILANNSSSGRIQPYLVNPSDKSISMDAFKQYEAQNLVLPRVSISFPLRSESLVFMSYDKLAQYPTAGQTYVPFTTYYFMQSNISRVLPNPELKARVKTEYNIGLTQQIGDYATLKLWASYANVVNDVNQFRVEQAYPYSYTTYANIDFSTIRRYVTEYQFQNGRIGVNGSYALQFADGTGSNANSAASLIQSGQPNLRSLFPLAYDNRHTIKGAITYQFGKVTKRKDALKYSGPYIKGKPVLQGVVIAANMQSISGLPFTSIQRAISEAQSANGVVQRAQTKGNPFGSRMPWTHNLNMNIQKGFTYKGKEVGVYLMIDNVLNNKIVRNVYQYTGLAGDDGYLNSPHGQQQAQSQIDAATFAMLYKLRMNNPGNFGAPRMFNLGVKMDF